MYFVSSRMHPGHEGRQLGLCHRQATSARRARQPPFLPNIEYYYHALCLSEAPQYDAFGIPRADVEHYNHALWLSKVPHWHNWHNRPYRTLKPNDPLWTKT